MSEAHVSELWNYALLRSEVLALHHRDMVMMMCWMVWPKKILCMLESLHVPLLCCIEGVHRCLWKGCVVVYTANWVLLLHYRLMLMLLLVSGMIEQLLLRRDMTWQYS